MDLHILSTIGELSPGALTWNMHICLISGQYHSAARRYLLDIAGEYAELSRDWLVLSNVWRYAGNVPVGSACRNRAGISAYAICMPARGGGVGMLFAGHAGIMPPAGILPALCNHHAITGHSSCIMQVLCHVTSPSPYPHIKGMMPREW